MIVLSPNPATDFIKIVLQADPSDEVVIDIFDSQVIKVISTSLHCKEKTIDISSLPKCIYCLSAFNKIQGRGKVTTVKFIKE